MVKKASGFWNKLAPWAKRAAIIFGLVTGCSAAVGAVWGLFSHFAHESAQVENNTKAITAIDTKLDDIAGDTKETRGQVKLLVELFRDRAQQRNASDQTAMKQ